MIMPANCLFKWETGNFLGSPIKKLDAHLRINCKDPIGDTVQNFGEIYCIANGFGPLAYFNNTSCLIWRDK